MTYSKIYNQLDRAGLIEKILVESNFDKIGLVKGIQYLENFLGSKTFGGMKYWKDSKCDNTVAIVCRIYSELQIENNNKHITKYEYLEKAMRL